MKFYDDGQVALVNADCRLWLAQMADNSVDSFVTDPPYALESIVKRFGKAGAKPAQHGKDGAFARVGRGFMGHAWDTGEVAHDPTFWCEVLRVLKPGGHVVAFGGTRTYHRLAAATEDAGFEIRDQLGWAYGSGFPKSHAVEGTQLGEGWGTAIKPAWEPIVLARKPLSEKTVAKNVLKWGTGALNIEGCRVPSDEVTGWGGGGGLGYHGGTDPNGGPPRPVTGRFPANLLHDGSDEVLAAFPEASGAKANISGDEPSAPNKNVYNQTLGRQAAATVRGDSGSAARFFYCAKASKRDRNEGLDSEQSEGLKNLHPTVKPTALMRWLTRLVTPPGGLVVDPFMGSGSTGKACLYEGFRFMGVEFTAEYLPIAQARILFASEMEF